MDRHTYQELIFRDEFDYVFKTEPSRESEFAKWMLRKKRRILKHDYDWLTLIFGYEGTGKSTFAIRLAKLLNEHFGMRYIYFDNLDTIRFFDNIRTVGNVHLFDEGEKFFNRRRAMSTNNIQFLEYFLAARTLQQFYIIISPRPTVLERDLFRRANMIAILPRRGVAFVYHGKQVDRLDLALNKFSKEFDNSYSDIEFIKYAQSKFNIKPNFILRFGPLEREDYENYVRIKKEILQLHIEASKNKLIEKNLKHLAAMTSIKQAEEQVESVLDAL